MSDSAEIPYPTTIYVRDTCLCLHMQRAARALARRFDDALRPFGLTNGQFSLMMALNRPQPPTIGAVASVLAMDRTTLTAALKPLERRGLVRLIPNENDKRSRLMSLTPEGRSVLKNALPVWEQTHKEVDADFGDGDMERLRRDLRTISDGAKVNGT
jgi:DNA-binding MarR family transcriptional regulator